MSPPLSFNYQLINYLPELEVGPLPRVCDEVICPMLCQFGFKKDERRCQKCECLEPCEVCLKY